MSLKKEAKVPEKDSKLVGGKRGQKTTSKHEAAVKSKAGVKSSSK